MGLKILYSMELGERRNGKEDDSVSNTVNHSICEGRGHKDVY
jgi:hypothetical protein